MKLLNKTAVVTGSSDGIGKQVALKLAEKGVNLALIARDKTRLSQVQKEITKISEVKVKTYSCDIRKNIELKQTVSKVINDFKTVDILINVAGIWQKMMPAEQIEENVVDNVIQTNLTALIHFNRLFIPYLKKRSEAAIINISSKSGVVAQANQAVYTASKWGVTGFTEVLKAELKGTTVRVAGIYQSGTNTKMFAKVGEQVPNEKFTHPSDLADVIVYMLSRPKQIWLHEIRVEY
jgi:short-subunit dehydrogenase